MFLPAYFGMIGEKFILWSSVNEPVSRSVSVQFIVTAKWKEWTKKFDRNVRPEWRQSKYKQMNLWIRNQISFFYFKQIFFFSFSLSVGIVSPLSFPTKNLSSFVLHFDYDVLIAAVIAQ